MLRTVFLKSLYDQRRALLGWIIGVVALVGLMSAIWPTFREMPDLEQFLANYPEGMRKLFNIEAITTGTGYLNAELFSMLLPILFIVFAIGRGARAVAGEEEAGTLDVLLVTRVSPARLVLEQAGALLAALLALGMTLFAVTLGGSAAAGMGVGVGGAATGALAMVLLGMEFGGLALAVGAITGRRSWAIAAGSIAAVASYVLYVVGRLVEAVEPWLPISPFHQALDRGPLGASLPPAFAWLVLPAIAVLLLAIPAFDRRDIAAR